MDQQFYYEQNVVPGGHQMNGGVNLTQQTPHYQQHPYYGANASHLGFSQPEPVSSLAKHGHVNSAYPPLSHGPGLSHASGQEASGPQARQPPVQSLASQYSSNQMNANQLNATPIIPHQSVSHSLTQQSVAAPPNLQNTRPDNNQMNHLTNQFNSVSLNAQNTQTFTPQYSNGPQISSQMPSMGTTSGTPSYASMGARISTSTSGPPKGPPGGMPLSQPPAGPPLGPPSGPPHGLPSGPPHGPPAGPPLVPSSGPPHGLPSGPPVGPPSGPPLGLPSGPPVGALSSPPLGAPSGPPHGPPSGPPHGPPSGSFLNQNQSRVPQANTNWQNQSGLQQMPPRPTGPPAAWGSHQMGQSLASGPPGPAGPATLPAAPLQQQYPPHAQQTSYQQPGPMQPPPQSMQARYANQAPNQAPPTQPTYGYPNQHSAQPQQRLDPDAMPSVVQVIEDDRIKFENNDVMFTTSIPASVPPLVTTIMQNEYNVVNDGGCARPLHLRSTLYQVPVSEDTLKTTNIPLAIVVQPFDDLEVDGRMVVPVSNSEILRCNRCKAYMNPYMRFIDAGRRFQCSLCHHLSEVTPSYFANLDHTGQRLDKFHRPELYLGSYEFRATAEYCRNGILNARRPHIIFACELTTTSKPILNLLASNLSDIIKNYLPRDPLNPGSPPPLIGFLTYNSKIQMYDIVNNGHAHIICDVASTFPPLTTFLVDPLVYGEQIESFLQSLPTLYSDEELETQTVLGPVIEAALHTCQVDKSNWIQSIVNSEAGSNSQQNANGATSIPVGKMYLFHCTLPTYGTDADTPGRLKPRWTTSPDEVRKLLGTDKEKAILAPDTNKYYNNLGQRCVTDFASGVELFLFPPVNGSYLDIATLGELVRLSGSGAIFKYFNDFSDRFLNDLKFSLRSSFAFDAIMKVRTSTGIRAHEYVGNFYARTTSDIECAAINTGSNIAVELKYDDKLPEDEFVVIQVATLYTSLCGERRVRVHNIAFSPCQQIADVYRHACCDTTINLLLRQVVSSLRLGEKTVQQAKELLITRAINILTAYRRHCAQPGSSLGQLILPEALKLLPMYICGALKCDAIDGGPEMTPDDKAFAQIKLLGSSLSLSQVILYPRLLKIEYEDVTGAGSKLKWTQIRCSSHKITGSSALAYLLENGSYILLYIPNDVVQTQKQFFSAVFGPHVDVIQKIQPELGLPKLLTEESNFLNQLVENIENERKKAMRIFVIRQGIDKLESIFRSFLYEDKKTLINAVGGDNSKFEGPSYVDLLCHLHKEIRAQLN